MRAKPASQGMRAAAAPSRRLAAALATVSAIVVMLGAGAAPSRAQPLPVFGVTDPTDAPDFHLDGRCESTYLGLCTLRAAIQEAEHAGGGIVFLSAGFGPYRLTIPPGAEATGPPSNATGDLDISTHITVTGVGPDVSVIDGVNAHRIFDVRRSGFLWLTGVALQNGKADYDDATHHEHGGAIHNHGNLILDHVAVINSTSISPSHGWGGGGITNASTGWAELLNVTVARNRTNAQGGGIENFGELRMLGVTIAQNKAPAGHGSGLYLAPRSKTFLEETLVAKNGSRGNNCAVVTAAGVKTTIQSYGANLQGDRSCHFTSGKDRTGNPGFDRSLPGPPLFYPLLPTSRAIDTDTYCWGTDIRGVPHPQDGNGDGVARCDTGSYEREATP
jgi:hypothetical protein